MIPFYYIWRLTLLNLVYFQVIILQAIVYCFSSSSEKYFHCPETCFVSRVCLFSNMKPHCMYMLMYMYMYMCHIDHELNLVYEYIDSGKQAHVWCSSRLSVRRLRDNVSRRVIESLYFHRIRYPTIDRFITWYHLNVRGWTLPSSQCPSPIQYNSLLFLSLCYTRMWIFSSYACCVIILFWARAHHSVSTVFDTLLCKTSRQLASVTNLAHFTL